MSHHQRGESSDFDFDTNVDDLMGLQNQLRQQDSQIEELNQTIRYNQLNHKKVHIELTNELENEKKRVTQMEETLRYNLNKIRDSQSLQNLAKELENKLTETENQLMEVSQRDNQNLTQIAQLEEENNFLQTNAQIDDSNEELLKKEKQELEAQATQLKQGAIDIISEKQNRISQLEETLNRLMQGTENLPRENEELRGMVHSLERDLDMNKSEYENQRQRMQNELSELSNQYQQQELEWDAKYVKLQNEVNDRVFQILQTHIDSAQNVQADLMSQLHISEERMRMQEQSIMDMQRVIENSKTQHQREIASLENQVGEYMKLRENYNLLQEKSISLEHELRSYREATQSKLQEKDSLITRLQTQEEEMERKSKEYKKQSKQLIQSLRHDLKQKTDEKDSMQYEYEKELRTQQSQFENEKESWNREQTYFIESMKENQPDIEDEIKRKLENSEFEHDNDNGEIGGNSLQNELAELERFHVTPTRDHSEETDLVAVKNDNNITVSSPLWEQTENNNDTNSTTQNLHAQKEPLVEVSQQDNSSINNNNNNINNNHNNSNSNTNVPLTNTNENNSNNVAVVETSEVVAIETQQLENNEEQTQSNVSDRSLAQNTSNQNNINESSQKTRKLSDNSMASSTDVTRILPGDNNSLDQKIIKTQLEEPTKLPIKSHPLMLNQNTQKTFQETIKRLEKEVETLQKKLDKEKEQHEKEKKKHSEEMKSKLNENQQARKLAMGSMGTSEEAKLLSENEQVKAHLYQLETHLVTSQLQWVEEKSFLEDELRKSEQQIQDLNEKYNDAVQRKDYYELQYNQLSSMYKQNQQDEKQSSFLFFQ